MLRKRVLAALDMISAAVALCLSFVTQVCLLIFLLQMAPAGFIEDDL